MPLDRIGRACLDFLASPVSLPPVNLSPVEYASPIQLVDFGSCVCPFQPLVSLKPTKSFPKTQQSGSLRRGDVPYVGQTLARVLLRGRVEAGVSMSTHSHDEHFGILPWVAALLGLVGVLAVLYGGYLVSTGILR